MTKETSIKTKKVVKTEKVKPPNVSSQSDKLEVYIFCVKNRVPHKSERIVKFCKICEECKKKYGTVVRILQNPKSK